jgi:hypothetical protein
VESELALPKMTMFRCFQIHHAVSIGSNEVPFRGGRSDSRHHHSMKSSSRIAPHTRDRPREWAVREKVPHGLLRLVAQRAA